MDKIEKDKIMLRLSTLRTQNNLSARKLSELIGKNYGYIHKLENSKDFLPTIDTLYDILEVCHSTPAEFFYYDMKQYRADMEIIELLSTVDNETKQAVITMLKKAKK